MLLLPDSSLVVQKISDRGAAILGSWRNLEPESAQDCGVEPMHVFDMILNQSLFTKHKHLTIHQTCVKTLQPRIWCSYGEKLV